MNENALCKNFDSLLVYLRAEMSSYFEQDYRTVIVSVRIVIISHLQQHQFWNQRQHHQDEGDSLFHAEKRVESVQNDEERKTEENEKKLFIWEQKWL